MNSESDKIKQLLLADELALLQQLREKVLESEHFSEAVADVLATATQRAWKKDPAYQASLAKPIGEGLKTALKREQRSIIDAFVPVIGPMIRASVSASIKKLMADLNRILELGLSPKAIKWRWQSWKTGVPFAELVFLNTVEYQVQHAFLIDKDSGLLIEYAGHEGELARDKDAFSAMLTAINDFVADTLADDTGSRLRSAELGEYQLWIIDGPRAYLAVLIKGNPSERLRESLQDALDKIHFLYAEELANSDQYGQLPPVRLELEDLLITKNRQADDDDNHTGLSRQKGWIAALVLMALVAWGGWRYLQHKKQLHNLTAQLKHIPGFVLQDIRSSDDGLLVTGLKDPLADLSVVRHDGVKFRLRPYLSLDASLVQKRLQRLSEGTALQARLAENGQVTLSGTASENTLASLRRQLLAMPGVNAVDSTQVTAPVSPWQRFLSRNPVPENIQATMTNQQLTLQGETSGTQIKSWLAAVTQAFPDMAIDTRHLRVLPDKDALIAAINASVITMPRGTQITAEGKQSITSLADKLKLLQQQDPRMAITLTGSTDCTGSPEANQKLAQRRAEHVKQALVQHGVDKQRIQTDTKPCASGPARLDPALRRVTTKVIQPAEGHLP